ncbi:MAG: hypothetical protein CMH64_00090 [Nanoarchaeota archaeon]|nr:hypothetical protein [Nanoarchaeota archaeon]
MNKNLILLGFLIVLVSGCVQTPTGGVVMEPVEEFYCNSPYIEYQKGNCCLDQNNNNVCDNDEVKTKKIVEEIIEEEVLIEEECPYTCTKDRECMQVFKEGVAVRWACA